MCSAVRRFEIRESMEPSNTLEYEPTPPAKPVGYVRSALVFGFGAMLGALLWALSPRFTGEAEAWDSAGFYYFGGLFIAGFVAAWVFPKRFWLAPIGIYVGQMGYVWFATVTGRLPGGGLWLLGACTGLAMCVIALAGAALTFGIARLADSLQTRKATSSLSKSALERPGAKA